MLKLSEMREMVHHGASMERPPVFYHDTGNGELYIPTNGITHSDPRILAYFQRRYKVEDAPGTDPWLPFESRALLDKSDQAQMVIAEGDLGVGKSTALYGARTMLRREEQPRPYTMVNGHFLNQAKKAVTAIRQATAQGKLVIYDSFDYLFMKNGKQRLAKFARPIVLDALRSHLDEGGRVIATAHTHPWFGKNSNPQLTEEFAELLESTGAVKHRIVGWAPTQPELDALVTQFHGDEFAGVYSDMAMQSTEPTSRTYRVAKLMGAQVPLERLVGLSAQEFDARVRAIDAETRQRMGAPDDYSLMAS